MLLFAAKAVWSSTDYLVSTIAGGGSTYFAYTDGVLAVAEPLNGPESVAVDSAGNVYFVDGGGLIRKISAKGFITTVAGNGKGGSSAIGDGGPATSTTFLFPGPLATDRFGNLYIADNHNHRIRKVDAAGIITSVAGGGTVSSVGNGVPATSISLGTIQGLAVDASANILFADGTKHQLLRLTPTGTIAVIAGTSSGSFPVGSSGTGDNGPALLAQLADPRGIAVDSAGNIYFCDGDFNSIRIRKVSSAGTITAFTTGSAPFGENPTAISLAVGLDGTVFLTAYNTLSPFIAVDSSGTLHLNFFVNSYPPLINNGDGGPASAAQLKSPNSVAADLSGNVYVTDATANRVRKLTPTSQSLQGCMYSVQAGSTPSGTTLNMDYNGGIGQIDVVAARSDCPWLAETNADWATIESGVSGTGNGTVSYAISANPSTQDRIATLAVAGRSFGVAQAGAPPAACPLTASPAAISVSAAGATGTISITSSSEGCSWSAAGNMNWLFLTSGTSATTSGNIGYAVAANSGPIRTGTIAVIGRRGTTVLTTLSITVTQGPPGQSVPVISAIRNAASGATGTIAGGEFVAIYGAGLGPTTPVSGFLLKGLGGTRVFFSGIEAFLTYASAEQINALVPGQVANATSLQVTYQGLPSSISSVPVVATVPGVFTMTGSGIGAAVCVNQDGTFNSPANAAPRGSIIAVWFTGGGQTRPGLPDGQQPTGPPFPTLLGPVAVQLGGITIPPEDIAFVGLVYAGVVQLNLLVEQAVPAGSSVELVISVAGAKSTSGVTVSIH